MKRYKEGVHTLVILFTIRVYILNNENIIKKKFTHLLVLQSQLVSVIQTPEESSSLTLNMLILALEFKGKALYYYA